MSISSADVWDNPYLNRLILFMILKVLIVMNLGNIFVAGVNQYVAIISAKTG